jgi:hypothetical protein
MKEQKPVFVVNSVLPNTNYGTILLKGQPASTGDWMTGLFEGKIDALKGAPPSKSSLSTRKNTVTDIYTRMVCGCSGYSQTTCCCSDQSRCSE